LQVRADDCPSQKAHGGVMARSHNGTPPAFSQRTTLNDALELSDTGAAIREHQSPVELQGATLKRRRWGQAWEPARVHSLYLGRYHRYHRVLCG
jgi:hypothetical protein